MHKLLTITALLTALTVCKAASALDCATDTECLSATISLMGRATKLQACPQEVKAAANVAADPLAQDNAAIVNLERCVAAAQRQAKLAKARQSRVARINKALSR